MDDECQVDGTARERVDGSWLVLAYPGNPTIRLDARLLDRVMADDEYLVLVVGDVPTSLLIPAGSRLARDIAERLAPYTRSAPITRQEVYKDAKRRLDAAKGRRNERAAALFFGAESVHASDEILYIGDFTCLTSDVRRYAEVGAALPLPNGKIQAGLAMLVVADRQRREDPTVLAQRLAEYEARVGPNPDK